MTVAATPLRFASWVPEAVREDVQNGFGPGLRLTTYRQSGAPDIVAYSHEDPSGHRQVELLRFAPEDEALALAHTRGNEDAARRLLDVAGQHNRDLRHLVVDLGISPGEAQNYLRTVDDAVFRTFLEGVSTVYGLLPGIGRLPPTASWRARPRGQLPVEPSDSMVREQRIIGAAQKPKHTFRPNVDGPRSPEDAIALAEKYGIEFPEDAKVIFVRDAHRRRLIPESASASYFDWKRIPAHRRVGREDFVSKQTQKIPVRVSDRVLESDEAILAILAHEAFELRKLDELFETHETVSALQLARLINDRRKGGSPGNLHEQAWDEANRLVDLLRNELSQ